MNGEQVQRDARHRKPAGIMPAVDQTFAVLQDCFLILDQGIRRQAALAIAHADRTAAGVKAHADVQRGFDRGVEGAAVRIQIMMVA